MNVLNKIPVLSLLGLLTVMPLRAQRVMTLQQCIAEARNNNMKARDAAYSLQMAKEQQKYARSKYYPSLSANAWHFQSSDYLLDKSLFSGEMQDALQEMVQDLELDYDPSHIRAFKRGTSMGLSAFLPVYTGGRIHTYNKLADLQVEGRLLQQGVADDEIVMNTENLYYMLLQLYGKDKTLTAIDREVASIRRDAQNLADEGIVTTNDVVSVELYQDQLSSLHIKLDNGRRLLRRALAQYIGMADEDIDIDTTMVVADAVSPETLWMEASAAVDNRGESRLLDLWVEKAGLDTHLARAAQRPMLLLGGTLSHTKLFEEWNDKAIAVAYFSMPLSSFWSERHEIRRKKIAYEQALDFRRDKRELMNLQVRDAYDNLSSAYRQIAIGEKSRQHAEENLRAKREQYVNGTINMSILLDAQRQVQQAHDQHTDALIDYARAKEKYLILTGRESQQTK